MTHRNLTCTELDNRLGEYLARGLNDSSVAEIELHLSGCPSCAALVRDLEEISREAASLPVLSPSTDLWPAIAQRLDAPIVDLPARASTRVNRTRTPSWHRLRAGAIAAGLMGITAIGTFLLTRRATTPQVAVVRTPIASTLPTVLASDSTRGLVPDGEPSARQHASSAAQTSATAMPVSRAVRIPARDTYTAEILSLRGIVSQRRDELDPRTIAVIESSLSTIDSAIAEARHALQVDPASRFLSAQLNKALEKKLGLLRTAALLPSRT